MRLPRKDKTLVPVDEVEQQGEDVFVEKATGEKLNRIVTKMSKTLKNVVSPDEPIGQYGADTCRLYVMFMGPLEMSKPWNTNGLIGVYRFLERVKAMYDKELNDLSKNDTSTEASKKLTMLLHKTIKKVTEDTQNLSFNTAISQMMIFVNECSKEKTYPRWFLEDFALLLAPYAPHLAEELWEKLGKEPGSISKVSWPSYDEQYCQDDECTIAVQINGKLRATFAIAVDTAKDIVEAKALELNEVRKWLDGKTIKKVIVVPNKIVNIVVS